MYIRYMLLCCFMPALFAADKREQQDTRVIQALDLHSYQLLQGRSDNRRCVASKHDTSDTLRCIKGLADKYCKLKAQYKQQEQKNLELEAIISKLNQLLLARHTNTEVSQDSSCCSSSSTSPVTDIASSPSLVATGLCLQKDGADSPTNQLNSDPRLTIKKLPGDRFDVNYYRDCQKLGHIPFYRMD